MMNRVRADEKRSHWYSESSLMEMQYHPHQAALVTLLTPSGGKPSATARILDISGRRIRLICDLRAQEGAPVKVEWSEYFVLADVLGIQNEENVVTLHIRHALTTSEIENLRQRWI